MPTLSPLPTSADENCLEESGALQLLAKDRPWVSREWVESAKPRWLQRRSQHRCEGPIAEFLLSAAKCVILPLLFGGSIIVPLRVKRCIGWSADNQYNAL
jgi:hypothetical protein